MAGQAASATLRGRGRQNPRSLFVCAGPGDSVKKKMACLPTLAGCACLPISCKRACLPTLAACVWPRCSGLVQISLYGPRATAICLSFGQGFGCLALVFGRRPCVWPLPLCLAYPFVWPRLFSRGWPFAHVPPCLPRQAFPRRVSRQRESIATKGLDIACFYGHRRLYWLYGAYQLHAAGDRGGLPIAQRGDQGSGQPCAGLPRRGRYSFLPALHPAADSGSGTATSLCQSFPLLFKTSIEGLDSSLLLKLRT